MVSSAKTAAAAEPTGTTTEPSGGAAEPAGQSATEQAAIRPLPLWRNLQFQTLWIGTSASTLGVSVADIAYPLTVLAITRSPAMAGLFAAVQAIGMLMAG